jgi:uroporphyrinogen decarboxylase
MNDRERFLKIMSFETVDRIPNYELGIWQQTADRWTAEGMPRGNVYLNWLEGEPFFGIDRRGFAQIYVGMWPGFEYQVLEEDERYIVARHPNGIITKALKEGTVRGMRMCMDTYISFPVTDRESFRRLIKEHYDPYLPIRYPQWWSEWVRIWKTRDYPLCLLANGSFGLYSGLRAWVGTESISYLFYDDPAFVEEMLDFLVDFMLTVVDRAIQEVQFDYFNFFEDFAGKGTPLVSPQIFRKFLLPRYKKIIGRLQKAGIRYFWLDSDGTIDPLIPLLIDAGITCIWPLEQAAGMDPLRLRKEYGKDLVLVGGIDKRELAKDKKSIERELYAKIPPMLELGGFIPHIDHTVPPDISYDNFMYYMELKRKLIGAL